MDLKPTHLMLDGADVPTTSDTVYPQRVLEDYGTAQVESTALTFELNIRGRSAPDAPWSILATITEADVDQNGTAVTLVALLPEMSFDLAALSDSACSAWLNE